MNSIKPEDVVPFKDEDVTIISSSEDRHEYHSMGSSPFERIEYDVTDPMCQRFLILTCPFHFLPLVPGFMGTKTMILEPEEAVLKIQCQPFCDIETRRPYGELGSVDKSYCLCCVGVSSGLTQNQPLCIGSGCEYDRVEEIVAELKRRMKARGDTGQIARTEEALREIRELRAEMGNLQTQVALIAKALQVPTETTQEMERI